MCQQVIPVHHLRGVEMGRLFGSHTVVAATVTFPPGVCSTPGVAHPETNLLSAAMEARYCPATYSSVAAAPQAPPPPTTTTTTCPSVVFFFPPTRARARVCVCVLPFFFRSIDHRRGARPLTSPNPTLRHGPPCPGSAKIAGCLVCLCGRLFFD